MGGADGGDAEELRSETARFAPLRHREFRLLFCARTTSVVGDGFSEVALAFAVLQLTGSAADLGIVFAARSVPLVLLVLLGGVWADRVSRRRLLVVAQSICALSQALLALLLITGAAQLWQLAALNIVYGLALALFRPAAIGLVPEAVPRHILQEANALTGLGISTGEILGPILGGMFVTLTSPGWAIGLDALSFALSAALILRMRVAETAQRQAASFWQELAEGWHEVRSRSWLWASIVYFALFQFVVLGSVFVLGPVVAQKSLGGASAWGTLLAASGVGSVLGGLAALRVRPRRLLVAAYVGILGVIPSMELLALGAPLWVLMLSQLAFGAAMTFGGALWETALQLHVPRHALSRVAAYDWMGSTALRPFGFATAGRLADGLGVGPVLSTAGVLMLCMTGGVLSLTTVRRLVRSSREEASGSQPSASQVEG